MPQSKTAPKWKARIVIGIFGSWSRVTIISGLQITPDLKPQQQICTYMDHFVLISAGLYVKNGIFAQQAATQMDFSKLYLPSTLLDALT